MSKLLPPVVIKHTPATQTALGGYAKGALVLRDGVVWKSLVDGNKVSPGGGHSWTLFD
jgi:hypothetical protein